VQREHGVRPRALLIHRGARHGAARQHGRQHARRLARGS
jgi:hypothetical protein